MSNIKNRKEDGFTIIEVLIVLAIAGLIMLIVFLAVPALQRNSRNTQRKNDVAAILSGMTEYTNNNSGTAPASKSGSGNTLTLGATGTNTVDVKLGYYGPGDITLSVNTVVGNATTQDTVTIAEKTKCNGSDGIAGASRAFAALFTLEPSAEQCQES